MANITNYVKHGYFTGIEDIPVKSAMKIFCHRRSQDIVKSFQSDLSYMDLIARIYYQGLLDGEDIFNKKPPESCNN